MRFFCSVVLVAVTSITTLAPSQARLLADLATRSTNPPSSRPTNFIFALGRHWFVANDGMHGRELWVSDGTSDGTRMVADVRPGLEGSVPTNLIEHRGELMFFANDGTYGNEPWLTDGTAAGTRRVADVAAGTGSVFPFGLDRVNDRIVFSVAADVRGVEPWVTDGTAAGTHILGDLWPGASSSIDEVTAMFRLVRRDPDGRERLWFAARIGTMTALWETDGTVSGTTRLTDLPSSGYSAHGAAIEVPSGRVVFVAARNLPNLGTELWATDGTTAGTVRISWLTSLTAANIPPRHFAGRAWFGGMVGSSAVSTDGTAAGTRWLLPRSGDPLVEHVRFVGGQQGPLFGLGWDGLSHRLLRFDDPSSPPTVICTLPFGMTWIASGPPPHPSVHGSRLLLLGEYGFPTWRGELWAVDLLTGRSELLGGIAARLHAEREWTPALAGGPSFTLYSMDAPELGTELGRSDGTRQRTVCVKDILVPPPGVPTSGSNPHDFVPFGSRIVFRATANSGAGLWITDGTPPQTRQLGIGLVRPRWATTAGARLFFVSESGNGQDALHVCDGTPESVRTIPWPVGQGIRNVSGPMASLGDRLILLAHDNNGLGGYVCDGESVRGLVGLGGQATDAVPGFAVAGSVAFFRVRLPGILPAGMPARLLRTDGTTAGTWRVADVGVANAASPAMVVHRDRLWFFGNDAAEGDELWCSDGTVAGTRRITTLWPGPTSLPDGHVAATDAGVFVVAAGEMWFHDPVSGLTTRIGSATAGLLPPKALGHRLVYDDGTTASASDGTAAGTFSLGVARDGPVDESTIVSGRRRMLFEGRDAGGNPGLYVTDGSPSGTTRLDSLTVPPPHEERTALHATANGVVVFAATHPAYGAEPWIYEPGANTQVFGAGCGSGTRTPSLTGDHEPLAGPWLDLAGHASAGQIAVVFASAPPAASTALAPGSPCMHHVDRGTLLPWLLVPIQNGTFAARLTLPQDPSLFGTAVVMQSAVLPTDRREGFDLTNGLHVILGR